MNQTLAILLDTLRVATFQPLSRHGRPSSEFCDGPYRTPRNPAGLAPPADGIRRSGQPG